MRIADVSATATCGRKVTVPNKASKTTQSRSRIGYSLAALHSRATQGAGAISLLRQVAGQNRRQLARVDIPARDDANQLAAARAAGESRRHAGRPRPFGHY